MQRAKLIAGGALAAYGAVYFVRPQPRCENVHVVSVDGFPTQDEARRATACLEKDGAVVLRGGATGDMISQMQPMLRRHPRFEGRIAHNAMYRESSQGRFHLSFMGTRLQEAAVLTQQTSPWKALLRKGELISMIHLLDSKPRSSDQIWHADNTHGGYTCVVAMCDVSDDMGPTALQLGTHHLEELSDYMMECGRPARIARPLLSKGDVLIYNSKVLHRGEANRSQNDRPVIVFRYDEPTFPAPGVGAFGAQMLALYGSARS